MKSYRHALISATEDSLNMPNYETNYGGFIKWAEDICQLISNIYDVSYEMVTDDLYELVRTDWGDN